MSSAGHNLTFTLLDNLGHAIVTGQYNNQPFPTEGELAKKHGVSRSVTREAVKMLAAKRLVSARPRAGTTVEEFYNWNLLDPDVLRWMLERRFSLELLRQFTELRLAIEPQAAALAAVRGEDADHDRLMLALERMVAAERGEDDGLAADIEFFAQFRDVITTALPLSVRYSSIHGHNMSIPEHRAVADSIKNKDPVAAAEWMRRLIQEVLTTINRVNLKSAEPEPAA
jgi:DNA-binding FadR family transcriptional regulator